MTFLRTLRLSGQNNRGMTLLEVLLALAIFSIVAISFLNYFTNVNMGIIFSGKRLDATLKVKSLLDEINIALKDSNYKTLDDIKEIIENLLNSELYEKDYKIFTSEENFYEVDSSIHILISKKDVEVGGDIGIQHGYELRILNFYGDESKKVELSMYIPQGEEKNE